MVGRIKWLHKHNAAAARRGYNEQPQQLQLAQQFQAGAWQQHHLKGGGNGERWLAHPQSGTAIYPCICISAGVHPDNGAAYLLWPTTGGIPHGSAEERASYFGGLEKEHALVVEARAAAAPVPPAADRGHEEEFPMPALHGRQASTLLELMTVRAFHSKALRRHGLGTALGFRIRKGVLTQIPAIIVFVARKVHMQWLLDVQKLPCALEGPAGVWCEVDVLEFSHYSTVGTGSREPIQCQMVEELRGNDHWIGSGSQVASHETYGTLGAIVRSQTGERQLGFLTNRHVAVDLDYPSQKMFHPLPPKLGPGVFLGAVERAASFVTDDLWYGIFAGINPESFVRADGAFIPFAETFDLGAVTTTVKGLGEMGDVMPIDLQGPVDSVVGLEVVKVGRSSGLTKGCIMAYAVEYNDENGICFFTDFLIVGENKQGFDFEGDSGSLILTAPGSDGAKPRPLGIIWGGTANRGRLKLCNGRGPENWTSGVDLGRLLNLLQLDLVKNDAELLDDPCPVQQGDQKPSTGLERTGRPEATARGLLTFPPLDIGLDTNVSAFIETNSAHPLAVEARRVSRDSDHNLEDDEIMAPAAGQALDGEETSARYDSRRVQEDASLGLGLFDSTSREAKRRRSG